MKVVSIIGARPQFVKHAPVSRELRKKHEDVIVHTGQHYDKEMSALFFRDLKIPEPDYNLGVGSGMHGWQTGEMLKKIEPVLVREEPDVVFVYGDTNSTLAGALAAAKLHLRVGHVEAGMRSYDREMPEETNRVVADHCSDILFASTRTAVGNLNREGITKGVHLTGDVMVDALNDNIRIAEQKSGILDKLDLEPKKYQLATVHRAGNTDDAARLKSIVGAFSEIDNLVFPCHPRTEKVLKKHGLWKGVSGSAIKPIGYLDMLVLEKNSSVILTDSGGVQKESYILKVPCVTLRNVTEWPETVEYGWNVLVDADRAKIVNAVKTLKLGSAQREVFGDGRASGRIVDILEKDK